MTPQIRRAQLLLEQARYDLAENELCQALGEEPQNPVCHALLGLCLYGQDKYQEATESAERAIGLAPDIPFGYYVLAQVLLQRNMHSRAQEAIDQALLLDPEDPDYYAVLASIQIQLEDWSAALECAEEGLECDPEHVGCNNLRSLALVSAGRSDEAGVSLDRTLELDPQNALSHANMGWKLLHDGNPKKALEHFQEALRIDPELDWARQGLLEALKAHHRIYSLVLQYFLWMMRLGGRARWFIIIGAYILYRTLFALVTNNPQFGIVIWPVLIAYVGFVFMSWTADSLFNLVLFAHPLGRLALSREEKTASVIIGALLLTGLILIPFAFGSVICQIACIYSILLVVPVSGSFRCPEGWPQNLMRAVSAALGVSALATVLILALGINTILAKLIVGLTINLFPWCILIASLGANFLMAVQPTR